MFLFLVFNDRIVRDIDKNACPGSLDNIKNSIKTDGC